MSQLDADWKDGDDGESWKEILLISDFTILVNFFWLFQMFHDEGFCNPQIFFQILFKELSKWLAITNYMVKDLWS